MRAAKWFAAAGAFVCGSASLVRGPDGLTFLAVALIGVFILVEYVETIEP